MPRPAHKSPADSVAYARAREEAGDITAAFQPVGEPAPYPDVPKYKDTRFSDIQSENIDDRRGVRRVLLK